MSEIKAEMGQENMAMVLETLAGKLRRGEIEALRWQLEDNGVPDPWLSHYPLNYLPTHFKMTLDYKIMPPDEWKVLVKG